MSAGTLFDGKPFTGTRSPHNPLPRLPLLPGQKRMVVLGWCAEQIADALSELNELAGGNVALTGAAEEAPDGAGAAVRATWPEVVTVEAWGALGVSGAEASDGRGLVTVFGLYAEERCLPEHLRPFAVVMTVDGKEATGTFFCP